MSVGAVMTNDVEGEEEGSKFCSIVGGPHREGQCIGGVWEDNGGTNHSRGLGTVRVNVERGVVREGVVKEHMPEVLRGGGRFGEMGQGWANVGGRKEPG